MKKKFSFAKNFINYNAQCNIVLTVVNCQNVKYKLSLSEFMDVS